MGIDEEITRGLTMKRVISEGDFSLDKYYIL